jgi:ubiquinone/menaquinone biosynthesis C-methylase UbiE
MLTGLQNLHQLLRQAGQADWRTRAMSLSEAGRIARDESFVRFGLSIAVRRLSSWKRRFPNAASGGRHLRNRISDALTDRSWPVRVAAALALGECRASSHIRRLEPLLRSAFRAERIAAASAIIACGGRVDNAASLLDHALPAPARIGQATDTQEFLTALASNHVGVLRRFLELSSEKPAGDRPSDWAAFLAGPASDPVYSGYEAEVERYTEEATTEYLRAKPFSEINREQNIRLLHSFLAVCEHLRVPPGGRILDLGGGAGWVNELLARFGYQTFTVDLSSALLQLGRDRLNAGGMAARFMVGDMGRLPVASESMDAVVVMDSLHHVPDIPAVFLEAFRVLRTGGQFILAEPGEGHSEAEKSRSEMLEHGVLEQEIHLFEAMAIGKQAGFDPIRAVPHYVPDVAMSESQLKHATQSGIEDWMMFRGEEPGWFAPHVIQSFFSRPIVTFQKGERRVDSRMPNLLRADLSARLVRTERRVTGTVVIRNTGDSQWIAGDGRTGDVRLGIQLLTSDRKLIDREFLRARLSADIQPGGSTEISLGLELPDEAPYVLKIDMVAEGLCWFEDAGSRPVYVPVSA